MNARKPPSKPPNYHLDCRFLDESRSFACGFEVGRLALRMQMGETPLMDEEPIYAEGVEQLRLLAEQLGYDVEIIPVEATSRVFARLFKKPPKSSRPTLRLV